MASKSNSLTFTHLWTIDNFAHFYSDQCKWKWDIESDRFTPPDNEAFEFRLRLILNNNGEIKDRFLGIGWNATRLPHILEGKIKIKYKMSILNENGNKIYVKGKTTYFHI